MSTAATIHPEVAFAPRSEQTGNLLELDAQRFRENFDRNPFLIRHRLASHPLFELSRLLELSKRLPEANVEYNAGAVPISQDPTRTPRNGLSVQETIARIETCKSWLVLKNIELDREYEALLDACLAEFRVHSEPLDPGMMEKEGFIFITSPGSVTPFHIDIEHNFLLQIRGTKYFNIWPREDRTVLREQDIEGFFQGAHRNLPYKEEYAARGHEYELKPGDGLHSPIVCPHWVRNGNEVSVSFSVTFRTPRAHHRAHVYRMNGALRRWGITPKAPGESRFGDSLKSLAWRACSRAKGIFGGGKPDARKY